MPKICIITTGQPATNPRALKEAEALSQAGHEVRFIGSYWAPWAAGFDGSLQRHSKWSLAYAGGDPQAAKLSYYKTRLRHGAARRFLNLFPHSEMAQTLALCRTTSELTRAAKSFAADLYIAHYPGALQAAVEAAERHQAKVGYDAEDLYSAASSETELIGAIEASERRYLARCSYLTASSEGIAGAYVAKYGRLLSADPVTILNVFPMENRPDAFRPTSKEGPLRLYWFSQTIGRSRGLEEIIAAMAIIREIPFELHLRGIWQAYYKTELDRLLSRNDLPGDRMIAHPPALPTEMVHEAVKHDVGLALETPSGANANLCISNKILTYILAGNAVIATATEGQKGVMETLGDGGLCFQPGDTQTLAAQLKLWHQDRDLLTSVRMNNWKYGAARFNWDVEKVKFLDLIDNTLSQKSHKHAVYS